MAEQRLLFLHLSDIHFSKRSGTRIDLDQDVREQLEIDALKVREKLEGLTGILVSGDIAFSGTAKEYETAKKWLTQLTGQLDCPAENVWTIPGNHDVDREVAKKSLHVQGLHNRLRTANPANVD